MVALNDASPWAARYVEVPVDRIVYREVPFEVERAAVKEIPQHVERIQYREVPVLVEVLIERIVERIVIKEVEVERVRLTLGSAGVKVLGRRMQRENPAS